MDVADLSLGDPMSTTHHTHTSACSTATLEPRTESVCDDGRRPLAAAAHDLRTPFTDILGYAEMLLRADGAIDLRTVIHEIDQMLAPIARSRGVSVTVMVDDDVAWIPGDQLKIDRVFMNVIDNAIKFTQGGGQIKVRIERENDSVRISVIDTGVGISAENQHRVFEPFFRGTGASEESAEGVNLGLNTLKKIVEEHNGDLRLASATGVGTIVSILLPMCA